jgi:hypothetical protein
MTRGSGSYPNNDQDWQQNRPGAAVEVAAEIFLERPFAPTRLSCAASVWVQRFDRAVRVRPNIPATNPVVAPHRTAPLLNSSPTAASSSFARSSGEFSSSRWKGPRCNESKTHGVTVRTVAVRGSFRKSAISPK